MAYNEFLADRVRMALKDQSVYFEEKKMMGGLTFMVGGKMCVGIVKDELMARIGPEPYEEALGMPGVRQMDFTGKPMKGYVFVNALGMDSDQELEQWIKLAITFNKKLLAT